VKGALEAEGGVNLMTGYPGSPVAGFFDILGDISKLLQDKGIRAFQANNEAPRRGGRERIAECFPPARSRR